MLNRKPFFDTMRSSLFGGTLSASQVQGISAVLDEWERRKLTDLRHLAYMLATDYHETGRTMQAVRETLADSDASAVRRLDNAYAAGKLGQVSTPYWRPDAQGRSWLGRGLVQLTHQRNYEALGKATGIDLVGHPEKAMDLAVAVQVMFEGMLHGLFTGKKLEDYFSAGREDWVGARRIINGTDRAETIAGYGKIIHGALTAASK